MSHPGTAMLLSLAPLALTGAVAVGLFPDGLVQLPAAP